MKKIKIISNYIWAFCHIVWLQLPLYCALLAISSINLWIDHLLLIRFGAGLVLGTIAWAYIQTIPAGLLKSKFLRGSYITLILFINSLLMLVQLFCAIRLNEIVYASHIVLILNSNTQESSEFISTFVDHRFILMVSVLVLVIIAIYQVARLVKSRINSTTITLIITVICLTGVATTTYFGIWRECCVGRAVCSLVSLPSFEKYELAESQDPFDIRETHSLHPNIILIIGESFDKGHSNLYGYTKQTNPLLFGRYADSTLIVFNSVESPAPKTIKAMRQMMSLSENINDDLWYNRPMLPTALSKCGYQTNWMSNQNPNSFADNILDQIARLCDSTSYTANQYNEYKSGYDEILLPPFSRFISEQDSAKSFFCVLHLMGSHIDYEKRFPSEYSRFMDSDYDNVPENHRPILAAYDNSILYNDYVVDSIMTIADQIPAVVIYLSDHGQNIYYTREFFGHGSEYDPNSFKFACQIPLMIYFTTPLREKYSDVFSSLYLYKDKPFNSKYLMNTIMDIAGYDIPEYSINDNSLFEGKFGETTERNSIQF